MVVRRYASAAAGAYQFLPGTWKQVARELKLNSFEPNHQDQAALRLVERRGALTEVDRNGLTKVAMHKLAPEWASFPTHGGFSAYGQPVTLRTGEVLFGLRQVGTRLTLLRSTGRL